MRRGLTEVIGISKIVSKRPIASYVLAMTGHMTSGSQVFYAAIDMEDVYEHLIEKVYNQKRLHSALDYRSPDQFEEEVALNTIA